MIIPERQCNEALPNPYSKEAMSMATWPFLFYSGVNAMNKFALFMASSALLAGVPAANAASEITQALEASVPVLDLRARYEVNDADDAADAEKAEASTLRTLIGLKSGQAYGSSLYLEMVDVSALDAADYGPGTDGVADPEGNALNQAYVEHQVGDTTLRYGRQRIIYDGARFVGNVGWRQDEQTYDGVSLKDTTFDGVTLQAAYLSSIDGIKFSKADSESILFNAAFDSAGPGRLVTYAYALDDGNDNTNDTLGASYSGSTAGETAFLYHLEMASQSVENAAGGEADAIYSLLEAGVRFPSVTAKMGLEVLGSDEGQYGFQTPLATKHKYNGWADSFLATPDAGLHDFYVSVGGKVADTKLMAVFHDFTADEGSVDYGSELDLLALKKLGPHYTVGAKYASYSADTVSVDTDKFWLWGQASF
ncbi:conserved hypothetical protein [gamma proteobacterium HTCC5015]|nr:conserved hypothetical protein [gamma proteobacterium HTCC5015]